MGLSKNFAFDVFIAGNLPFLHNLTGFQLVKWVLKGILLQTYTNEWKIGIFKVENKVSSVE